MKAKKGYTLIEVLVTVSIIGTISFIAITNLLSDIKEHTVKNDVTQVEQAIKLARGSAVKVSSNVEADFTQAMTNQNETGGVIEIKKTDGTLLKSIPLSKNVRYNSSSSTISNDQIIFDFRGQPVDSDGNISGFTNDNNKVTISYYKGETPVCSQSITVAPVIGDIKTN